MSTDKDKDRKGPKVTIKQKGRRVERDPAKGTENSRDEKLQLLIKQYSENRAVFDKYSEVKNPAEWYARVSMDFDELKKKHTEETDKFDEQNVREQMARLQADFTNFKKRVEKDRIRMVQDAHGDLAVQLLPVVDNFDRAAEHVPEAVKNDQWYAGIEGIRKQFADILTELGIERIEAVGQPFDPELHEALGHEPSEEHDKDVVSKEFAAGYKMGDRVVRPAKVQVSSGKK